MSASACIAAMVRQVELESGMDMIQTEDGPKPLRRIIPAGWENALGAAFNHRAEPAEPTATPWPFPTHEQREAELMALLKSNRTEPRGLWASAFGSFAAVNFSACKQLVPEPKHSSPNAKPALAGLSVTAPLGAYRGLGFCDEG